MALKISPGRWGKTTPEDDLSRSVITLQQMVELAITKGLLMVVSKRWFEIRDEAEAKLRLKRGKKEVKKR